MDRIAFGDALRRQVVADLRLFRAEHPGETVYAYGLLGGLAAPAVGSVVATEEGLQRVAAQYRQRGYRYRLFGEVRRAAVGELAVWLRWANPDDGWYFRGLPGWDRVQAGLVELVEQGGLGERGEEFEEFCTDVLASLRDAPSWQDEMARGPVIVGLTYGEDPRDFLRTATRANPYPLVKQLWAETWNAEELRSRIIPPAD
jgi:hypothetical protein